MSRIARAAILTVVGLSVAAAAGAQQPSRVARGRVVSTDDTLPIAGVAVYAVGTTRVSAATGSSGRFRVVVPGGVTHLVAARIGFAPETLSVATADTLVFRLRPAPLELSAALVTAERTASAVSSSAIRALDIQLRPRESSQELLRLAPGLVIAQHAGGGKAEQIFLRGFDADHGTDVAVSVDGIPVNMPTHAHGQGYADLHWLMPEVVEAIDVRKGPFDARDGDFATAGAVVFRTRDRVRGSSVVGRAGSFDSRHLGLVLPLGGDETESGGYVAASTDRSDGPFEEPQGYRRVNAFAKWTAPLTEGTELVALGSAFDSKWSASGQVPERLVRAGVISRFGAVDATEGGATSRYDASVALRSRATGDGSWEARVWATRYEFDLFSNFTFFLADPVNGDGIEQVDDRTTLGTAASWSRPLSLLGRTVRASAGAGVRADLGDVALFSQRERERLDARVMVRSRQAHLHDWLRLEVPIAERLRLDLGLRADVFRFDVRDRLDPDAASDLPRPSGARWQGIVSPKLALAAGVGDATTVFAAVGGGFHSNDGRDAVLAGRGDRILPRAASAEVGARHTWSRGTVAVSLWATDLESELVYVGDEGVTEPSGRTRRVGTDVEARLRLTPWLWADADVDLARGRFRDEPRGLDRIPLAPTRTAAAGLTVRDIGSRRFADATASMRLRHVGARSANEDGSVRALGHTVWELSAAKDVGPARAFLAVDNLFGARWNEAQFATTSRLRHEAASVTELHFTPGASRAIQLGAEWRFR